MNKIEYMGELIALLIEKTKLGKILWQEKADLVTSQEVGDIRAIFRLDKADAYTAEWDVYQGSQQLAQIFNLRKYPTIKTEMERHFSNTLDDLFQYLVIQPRERALQKSLDALSKL